MKKVMSLYHCKYFCHHEIAAGADRYLRSYLIIYAVLLAAAAVVYVAANIVYLFGSLRASKSVHQLLIESVLGTTLRYVSLSSTKLLPNVLLDGSIGRRLVVSLSDARRI